MDTFRKLLTGFIAGAVIFFLVYTAFVKREADYKFVQPVMGTVFTVTIYGAPEDEARQAAQKAFALAHNIESELSRFRQDSQLAAVNRCQGVPQKVGGHFAGCLKQSIAVSELTGGYFDITFLPLYEAWDWRNNPHSEPSPDTIEALIKLVGYKKIAFDEKNSTVCLPAGMMIDFGGVAKGYAVYKMAELLTDAGLKDVIVNGGGDLVITSKRLYVIGVQDPFAKERGTILGKIIAEGPAAIFTSGDYEQFSVIGSKKYGHIIDPHTGRPASGLKSATIIDNGYRNAPGISAGVIAMGEKRAIEFVKSENIAALLVNESGQIYVSEKFASLAKFIRPE